MHGMAIVHCVRLIVEVDKMFFLYNAIALFVRQTNPPDVAIPDTIISRLHVCE